MTRQTATDRILARLDAKVRRDADALIDEHDGDLHGAADVAWERMEAATEGTAANHWAAVLLVIQRRADDEEARQ